MADFNIRVEGDDELNRSLEEAMKRAGDLREPFRRFDRTVGKWFRRRFETAGRFAGTPWKPLAPSTQERRLRPISDGGTPNIGGVDHPLWDSGNLKASFQEVGPESVRVIKRRRYERGSRVPYGVFHQQGRGVPKREIVPENLESRSAGRFLIGRLVSLIEDHTGEAFR